MSFDLLGGFMLPAPTMGGHGANGAPFSKIALWQLSTLFGAFEADLGNSFM